MSTVQACNATRLRFSFMRNLIEKKYPIQLELNLSQVIYSIGFNWSGYAVVYGPGWPFILHMFQEYALCI